LAHHVRVDLSEARVDRLWSRVSARVGGPRRARGWVWATAGVSLCAAAAVALVVARGRLAPPGDGVASSAWEGAQLETAADALAVTLVDGSSLKVEPRSRVEVGERNPSALKLLLARGRIACDVTHRPGRSFVVAAGGVEVRVVGTRFSVANEAAESGRRVEVRVERGTVEVRGAGPDAEVVRVEAGHSWSQVTKTEALAGEGEVEGDSAAPAAGEAETPAPAGASATRGRLEKGGRAVARAAPPAAAGARELFEEARSRWRAGRNADAARTYQALLDSYPRDPRAGLAAFELGRLKMDKLGDMAGAVQALRQAVALAPGAELREDALARLVAASAAARDGAECARARARYLGDYPNGVHHRTVDATACQ
jgi:transmembrane sensor